MFDAEARASKLHALEALRSVPVLRRRYEMERVVEGGKTPNPPNPTPRPQHPRQIQTTRFFNTSPAKIYYDDHNKTGAPNSHFFLLRGQQQASLKEHETSTQEQSVELTP